MTEKITVDTQELVEVPRFDRGEIRDNGRARRFRRPGPGSNAAVAAG